MRERDNSQHPEETIQPIATGIGGGRVVVPTSDLAPGAEQRIHGGPRINPAGDQAEGDADLLESGSPEFEHLRKPPVLPARNPEKPHE